ncbi:MAG: WxL domain-containing protein [Actinobacteria bacterium]|nr:WxL domain-containing protein [Actinomycetota bacterium]
MLSMVALAPAAHAADTTTTFSLTGGALSVTAPTTAALSDAAAGAAQLSGSLGNTTVEDLRGGTTGWAASATSTAFTGALVAPATIANSSVLYTGGLATTTGVVTAASTAVDAPMNVSVAAMSGTLVVGNNTATWNPGIKVNLPANALADNYSGTITHSVL